MPYCWINNFIFLSVTTIFFSFGSQNEAPGTKTPREIEEMDPKRHKWYNSVQSVAIL